MNNPNWNNANNAATHYDNDLRVFRNKRGFWDVTGFFVVSYNDTLDALKRFTARKPQEADKWNRAPLDATHMRTDGNFFYKLQDGEVYSWVDEMECWGDTDYAAKDLSDDNFVARYEQWDKV